MQTGWYEEGGCYFYFKDWGSSDDSSVLSGAMLTSGSFTLGNASYTFNSNGYCISGSGCSSNCDK